MNLVQLLAAGAIALPSFGGAVTIPRGTAVPLVFDQKLSSAHAKPGERVRMHVARNVEVHGELVFKAGTPVVGVIENVKKRGRWGKNASIRIVLNPVKDATGRSVPIQPRQKGNSFKGGNTGKAALLTGAGALVLGPIGLAGGYFIPGKKVEVKPGDKMDSEVSADSRR